MTREEKCKLFTERGYTYDAETGKIYSRFGREITGKSNTGYIKINNNKFELLGHQFAWYCVYGNCDTDHLDHINGIKDDNRISNLRAVNSMQNQWNRNDMKGYFFRKDIQKYKAQIQVNGKRKFIGHFNTEEEARTAYLQAKEKYHII